MDWFGVCNLFWIEKRYKVKFHMMSLSLASKDSLENKAHDA